MSERTASTTTVTSSVAVDPSTTVGPCTQRRAVLAALPGVVLLPGVLAACGSQDAPQPASTAQSMTTAPAASFPVSEVPVGTAKQVKAGDQYVILAQPTAGQFLAYSATCTHKGGTVQVIQGMHLRCPLHGAEFDAATGKNTAPPAPRPLDTIPVTVKGDQIMLS